MSTPVKVTVTGAAGAIGYALLFRIASGQMLGPDTPVALSLLEIPDAVKAAEGTAMELDDSALPLLASVDIHDDATAAFDGVDVALLVGARPRSKGMERSDLLEANGGIFKPQGEAINAGAADDVKVLVVGNPANTNALIAMRNAPDVPRERFTAMTRLDHNRAIAPAGSQGRRGGRRHHQHDGVGQPLHHAVPRRLPREGRRAQRRRGRRRPGLDRGGLHPDRVQARRGDHRGPRRLQRGVGGQRGRSTTCATGCTARRTATGCRCRSPPTGAYDVPEGIISSFPCTCANGEWTIVEGLEIDAFSRERIDASAAELAEEREAVSELL